VRAILDNPQYTGFAIYGRCTDLDWFDLVELDYVDTYIHDC
jgi:hypothetical protein